MVQVVDVTGRDERQPRPRRASASWGLIRACASSPAFWISTYVESLAEDLHEAVEVGGRVLGRFSSSAFETRPDRHPDRAIRPFEWLLEQLPVDARLVVVALEVARGSELDQVAVALARLREERQVRVALPLRGAVVGDVDLAADQRLDPVLTRLAVELDGPGE